MAKTNQNGWVKIDVRTSNDGGSFLAKLQGPCDTPYAVGHGFTADRAINDLCNQLGNRLLSCDTAGRKALVDSR